MKTPIAQHRICFAVPRCEHGRLELVAKRSTGVGERGSLGENMQIDFVGRARGRPVVAGFMAYLAQK